MSFQDVSAGFVLGIVFFGLILTDLFLLFGHDRKIPVGVRCVEEVGQGIDCEDLTQEVRIIVHFGTGSQQIPNLLDLLIKIGLNGGKVEFNRHFQFS